MHPDGLAEKRENGLPLETAAPLRLAKPFRGILLQREFRTLFPARNGGKIITRGFS